MTTRRSYSVIAAVSLMIGTNILAIGDDGAPHLLPKPGLFKSLTEPPCSYAITRSSFRMKPLRFWVEA